MTHSIAPGLSTLTKKQHRIIFDSLLLYMANAESDPMDRAYAEMITQDMIKHYPK